MSSMYWKTPTPHVPVPCAYCSTPAMSRTSNCVSCGGPLVWPDIVEEHIERRIDISSQIIDVTCFGDMEKVYLVGKKSAILSETVVRASVRKTS